MGTQKQIHPWWKLTDTCWNSIWPNKLFFSERVTCKSAAGLPNSVCEPAIAFLICVCNFRRMNILFNTVGWDPGLQLKMPLAGSRLWCSIQKIRFSFLPQQSCRIWHAYSSERLCPLEKSLCTQPLLSNAFYQLTNNSEACSHPSEPELFSSWTGSLAFRFSLEVLRCPTVTYLHLSSYFRGLQATVLCSIEV